MSPGSVWLLLVPLFNIVWQFIVVSGIASSLENEFKLRNMSHDSNPGKTIGLTWCILGLCGFIPFIGIFASAIALICFIIYWAKIAGYSSKIAAPYFKVNATRKCPQCAEEIKLEALVCRFCKHSFSEQEVARQIQQAELDLDSAKADESRMQAFEKRWK